MRYSPYNPFAPLLAQATQQATQAVENASSAQATQGASSFDDGLTQADENGNSTYAAMWNEDHFDTGASWT